MVWPSGTLVTVRKHVRNVYVVGTTDEYIDVSLFPGDIMVVLRPDTGYAAAAGDVNDRDSYVVVLRGDREFALAWDELVRVRT